jgi:hypothetical protein
VSRDRATSSAIPSGFAGALRELSVLFWSIQFLACRNPSIKPDF